MIDKIAYIDIAAAVRGNKIGGGVFSLEEMESFCMGRSVNYLVRNGLVFHLLWWKIQKLKGCRHAYRSVALSAYPILCHPDNNKFYTDKIIQLKY